LPKGTEDGISSSCFSCWADTAFLVNSVINPSAEHWFYQALHLHRLYDKQTSKVKRLIPAVTLKAYIFFSQGYDSISTLTGCQHLLQIRGDNYCAIRAVLFQALAGRLPTLNVFTRAEEQSKVEKVCMLLVEATCTAIEPSVVTTGCFQPPLLSS